LAERVRDEIGTVGVGERQAGLPRRQRARADPEQRDDGPPNENGADAGSAPSCLRRGVDIAPVVDRQPPAGVADVSR